MFAAVATAATCVTVVLAPLFLGSPVLRQEVAVGPDLSPSYTGPLPLIRGSILILCVGAVIAAVAAWRPPAVRLTWADWLVGGFMLLAGLSCAVSVDRYQSLVWLVILVTYACTYWWARLAVNAWRGRVNEEPRRGVIALGVAAAVSAAVLGLIGLREYIYQARVEHNPTWRIFAGFFNGNCAAGFLATSFPMALAVVALVRSAPARLAAGIGALAAAAALFLTGSKGGMAAWLLSTGGFAALYLLWAAGRRRRGKQVLLALAAVVVVCVGAALLLPPARQRILAAGGEQNSLLFRAYTWQAALHGVAVRPLVGWGPGTFGNAVDSFLIAGPTEDAHQDFLQVAFEQGVVSALALVAGLVALAVGAARRVPALASRAERVVAVGLCAGLAGFALHGLADYPFYVQATGLLAFSLAGALAGLTAPYPQGLAPSRWCRARWAGMSVLLVAGALFSGRAVAAMEDWKAGDTLLMQGKGSQALGSLTLAARDMPMAGEYHRSLAQAYLSAQTGGSGGELLGLARQHLLRAIALQPRNAHNHLWLARALRAMGGEAEARREYERAVALVPTYLGAWVELAQAHLRAGDDTGALRAAEQVLALEQQPFGRVRAVPQLVEMNYARAHLLHAKILLKKGEREAALADAKAAVELTRQYDESRKAPALGYLPGYIYERSDELRGIGMGLAIRALRAMGRDKEADEMRLAALKEGLEGADPEVILQRYEGGKDLP